MASLKIRNWLSPVEIPPSSPRNMFIPTLRLLKLGVISAALSVLPAHAAIIADADLVIQAERYTAMSGILTETTQDAGGGLNIRSVQRDDWVEYTIHSFSGGNVELAFRVASLSSTMRFDIFENGFLVRNIDTPTTNGWQVWKTVTTTVNLSAGINTLGLQSTGSGTFNLNWIQLVGGAQLPSPIRRILFKLRHSAR